MSCPRCEKTYRYHACLLAHYYDKCEYRTSSVSITPVFSPSRSSNVNRDDILHSSEQENNIIDVDDADGDAEDDADIVCTKVVINGFEYFTKPTRDCNCKK